MIQHEIYCKRNVFYNLEKLKINTDIPHKIMFNLCTAKKLNEKEKKHVSARSTKILLSGLPL